MTCNPAHPSSVRNAAAVAGALLGIALAGGCAAAPSPAQAGHGATAATPPGSAAPAPAPAASAGPPLPGRPGHPVRRLTILSASFVSGRTGWALGTGPCRPRASCPVVLRTTSDFGQTWSIVPAPPAGFGYTAAGIAPGSVGQLRFADSRDGWVFGPALWATHDGGRTWRRIGTGGLAVLGLAAGNGQVIATFGRCPTADYGCTSFRVYSSPAAADHWRPVPGTAGSGRIASLMVAAGTGYVATVTAPIDARPPRMMLLSGPAGGSGGWRRLTPPCPPRFRFSTAVAVTPHQTLAAGCGSEPGAGSQLKRAYRSPDGGHTWRRLADPPAGGYVGGESVTPAGTMVLSGGRMDLYLSWDGGRTWHTSPSLDRAGSLAGAGFELDATMITDTRGFAVQGGLHSHQIWLTGDTGHTWHAVTLH
jgi:hypothetical protein